MSQRSILLGLVFSISASALFGGLIGYLVGSYQARQFSEATYSYYLPPDAKLANQSPQLARNSTTVYEDPIAQQYYAQAKSVYREPDRYRDTDIAGVTTGKESLTSFRTLLEICQCSDELQEDGPYTVFAPTDTGFDKLSAEVRESLFDRDDATLATQIVRYHIVPGRYTIDEILPEQRLRTLNGADLVLRTQDGAVSVNGNEIRIADVINENGVMHTIDTVLLPPALNGEI